MCSGHISLFFKKISSIQGESTIGLQTYEDKHFQKEILQFCFPKYFKLDKLEN